jgi:hypothetical protein
VFLETLEIISQTTHYCNPEGKKKWVVIDIKPQMMFYLVSMVVIQRCIQMHLVSCDVQFWRNLCSMFQYYLLQIDICMYHYAVFMFVVQWFYLIEAYCSMYVKWKILFDLKLSQWQYTRVTLKVMHHIFKNSVFILQLWYSHSVWLQPLGVRCAFWM